MSIWANKDTKVIIQGITGKQGLFHGEQMLAYNTQLVGGVTPGKGGTTVLDGVPVFNTVSEAVTQQERTLRSSMYHLHLRRDSIMEAADSGIELIICITEGIPVIDMIQVKRYSKTNRPVSSDRTARDYHARGSKTRNYAGLHPYERPCRYRLTFWHVDV